MITQAQLATILTSRRARRRFVAASGAAFPPGWLDQLEISAQIVAFKRREAVARWFPSTVALCNAVPALSGAIDRFYDEPIPIHGADRRIRCGVALAAALRCTAEWSALGEPVGEVLRLETEVLRLTYHPPAEADPTGAPPPDGAVMVTPATSVRLAGGVRVLRFAVDVLMLWERPAEGARLLTASPRPPSLDRPVGVALLRRPGLHPVRAVRLGAGAADLLLACTERPESVAALLRSLPPSRHEPALSAIGLAVANCLLVAA
jgi:hypothetical protein